MKQWSKPFVKGAAARSVLSDGELSFSFLSSAVKGGAKN